MGYKGEILAIKLEIYLKRTNQTFESWLDANRVTKAEELMSVCSYVGLSASQSDVVQAAEIFKKRKQTANPEHSTVTPSPLETENEQAPKEPAPRVEHKTKSKKKSGPALIDVRHDDDPEPGFH